RHVPLNSLPVSASDLDATTYVLVRSLGSVLAPARPIAAVGAITNFDTGNAVVRRDIAIVQGLISADLTGTALVPLFIRGFGYFSQIEVVNAFDVAQPVTLTARGANGAVIPTGRN